ncbi:MAG TPA: cytochrome c biogenesis protein ResB, partial [Bacteroidales bacterium]|nr:cytochrome c biogenesis protein ResB [Bacteroidales bacterium]
GVTLIVIVLVVAAFGTIFPQEYFIPQNADPAVFYEQKYGFVGKLYYVLGLYEMYGSWWFTLLLGLLGLSILIASLDRVIPLYRSLKKQSVTRHDQFMKRQRLFSKSKVDNSSEELEKVEKQLIEKKYKVKKENGNLFAEKNRFSRWGPYVNHVGLLIILLGGMLRAVPGMYVDEMVLIREDETVAIPGTNNEYYIKNNEFILEMYNAEEDEKFKDALDRMGGMSPKNYQTNATVYKVKGEKVIGEKPDLEKIKDFDIKVNQPLKFDGYALYQTNYQQEMKAMIFEFTNKETNEGLGRVTIDLYNPKKEYDLGNGNKVILTNYYPDFEWKNNELTTKSKFPNNPGFVFEMFTPETPEGELSFVAIRQTIEPLGETKYKMKFAGMEPSYSTVLTVKRDYTLGLMILGATIFMIGVVQGMYWNHRRIWMKRVGDEVWISGHTNKNWLGLSRDIEEALENTALTVPEDQALEENGEGDK